MSGNVKLNFAAFKAFRQSPAVQAAIAAEAAKVAARANALAASTHAGQPFYDATTARDSSKGSTALASTGNTAARVDQAVNNTLLKALGGG